MRSVLVDGKFAVALDDCPMFVEEIEVWNINNKRKGFDHAVDSVMYAVSNIFALEQRHGELTPDDIPGSTSYRHHRGIPNTFDDSIPGSISSPITHVGSTRAQDKWN